MDADVAASAAVEIEVHHLVAIDIPVIALLARISPQQEGRLCEVWDSRRKLVASLRVPEPLAGFSLLHWVSDCLRQALAAVGEAERRPTLGSSTVWIRAAGLEAYKLSFGLIGDRVDCSIAVDAGGCKSLWDVVARVLPTWAGPTESRSNHWVLALDLEGTLISNAVSVFVRPGIYRFLSCARALVGRVVVFTSVSEMRFREIARLLVSEGSAPAWFQDVEYVQWTGSKKDLNFIPHADQALTLLVDDIDQYVCPTQREQWIAIREYEPLFEADDRELDRVLEVIARRTAG